MLKIMIEFVTEIGIRCSTMAWVLWTFQRSRTVHIQKAVFVLRSIFVDFSQNFSERALLNLKNQSRFQSQKSSSNRCGEIAVFVPCRFQSRIQTRFQACWNTSLMLQLRFWTHPVPHITFNQSADDGQPYFPG